MVSVGAVLYAGEGGCDCKKSYLMHRQDDVCLR